jgi:quercetin dioxygenase-like cupin family protein
MKRLVVLTGVVTLGISLAWSQTPAPTTAGATNPDPVNFTGKVTGYTTTDIRANRYSFEPGARTNWHTHERGQTITVEQGRLRTQEFGHALKHYAPNDTFFTAPGVKHWHGATPDAPMRQVSLSFGVTTWLEPVTDGQYSGAAAK